MSSRNADEYLVSVPKPGAKKYNVMRFNVQDQIDIRKWVTASLARDMSAKKTYDEEEVYPEFGEGSEYGRKQKEEARRLKYGIKRNKFNVENQPWNLTVTTIDTQTDVKKKPNGKSDIKPNLITKDYCGKKEGGIGEGSMYFIFTQRPDFTFEALPVEDWYNFKRKIHHRTLTDEEAEAAWDKRDRIVNHLNYMARKRLHITDEEEGAEEGAAKSGSVKVTKKEKGSSNLMIHDNEDYELYMSDSSSEEEENDGDTNKSKKKKNKKSKPEEKEDEKEEAIEDSDDGEHEGTEVAYASDVSSENEEIIDSKVVPRGLDELTSSSSSEDEEENKTKLDAANLESKRSNKPARGSDESASSSDSGSDIEDEDALSKSALFMQKKKTPQKDRKEMKSNSNSRSSTPNSEASGSNVHSKLQAVSKKLEDQSRIAVGSKRSAVGGDATSAKRLKMGPSGSRTSTPTRELSQHGITEEAVRRYLMHKPITTKDLLKKFKTKKTGLSSKQIVEKVAKILKKLDLQQSKIGGKMHLFLKSS